MNANIDSSFRSLNFVMAHYEEVSKYCSNKTRDPVSSFSLCMLERLNAATIGLHFLLKDLETNQTLEYSCGIILRSIFLDLIILLNAFEITGRPANVMQTELNQFCFDIMGDSVKHTLENLKDLYSQYPNNVIATMYSKLVAENPLFFEPYNNDGSYPVIKVSKKYTTKGLVRNIRNCQDLNHYKDIYDAYLYYSKYDHFGQMFQNISKQEFTIRLNRVNNSITYIPFAFMFSIAILLLTSHDNYLEKLFFEVKSYIESDPSISLR